MDIDREDEFADIRPYTEAESLAVLRKISASPDLINLLRKSKWPQCPQFLKPGANFLLACYLKNHFRRYETQAEMQKKFFIEKIISGIIRKTTNGFSYSGTDNLKKDTPYLYISNHRDIILDVALLNFVMNEIGFNTTEIAIGNNLLTNQFVEDLIRMNRSFIVKRNLPPREQIRASTTLSRYINHSLSLGNSVWIAQKEGRAKNGLDITNPAIIKMLHLSQRKRGGQFSDYVNRLNLAPVAISYELDPLDNLKGWELHHRDTRGEHKKRKGEDLISMVFGIKGQKGRIHYAFGSPLRGEFRNELDVAKAIDDFILANYRFWPTNYIAYDEINGTDRFRDHYTDAQAGQFLRRFKYLPSRVRNIVLRAYAAMLCHTLGEGVRVMEG